jgi:glycosyltransferase involved in cell wall biosynthesis
MALMTPTISVAIPTYNCAPLLRQTLLSVLAEDLPADQLDIAVVDDCSTKDDPESVVKELGGGRVRFMRHERNVGIARNFNACVRQARGDLVHILHGDDFVLPGFYSAVRDAAVRFPDVGLFCTRAFIVDEAGEIDSLTTRPRFLESPSRDVRPMIYSGNPLVTPSIVVRRSAYARVGLFEESLSHVADWEMWVRLIAACGGVSINRALAAYRVFAAQDTARIKFTGDNLREYLRLGDLWTRVLPGFQPVPFLRLVEAMAANQMQEFAARGMHDAVAANSQVLNDVRNRQQGSAGT